MPKGSPRKCNAESSSVNSQSSAAAQESASTGRPSRNRIAVRKFGTAPDEEFSEDLPEASPSCRGKQQKPAAGQLGNGYVLIHKSFWSNLCSSLGCSSCGKKCVQMKTEKLSGLASKLIMYCTACGVVLSQVTTSPDGDEDPDPEEEPDFEVNKRFVQFFLTEGKTYDDVIIFSKTLGIPVISKSMFEKYRDELLAASS